MSKWQIEGWCEWRQLATPTGYNWLNVTVLQLSGELTLYLGSAEITLVVLGFGLRVSYVYNPDAPKRKELENSADALKDMDVVMTSRDYEELKTAADNWHRMNK